MKNQGEPLAKLMAFSTLVIVGVSAKHCMKKYSDSGLGKHSLKIKIIRRRHPWRIF